MSTPELEERIYQDTVRAVIWGAEREEVFQKLLVNGISGPQAEELYTRARGERLALLRSAALKKAVLGLPLLIFAGALKGPLDLG